MKLPTGDLLRTPEEALDVLLDTHVSHATIKKGPEMVDQPDKIRANREEWKKAKQVVTEDRITWTVNNFIS